MKKFLRLTRLFVCLCAVLSSTSALAEAQWLGNSYIYVNGTWYQAHGTEAWASGGAFDGHDFGPIIISSLTIGGQLQIGDNGEDWQSGEGDWMSYAIYSGETQEMTGAIHLSYDSYGYGAYYNNMRFQSGGSIFCASDIDISSLPEGSTYTLKVWFGPIDGKYENSLNSATEYTATFTKVADISGATVSGVDASYDWTGSVIHPVPVVTLGETVLNSTSDYDVTYSEGCTNVGDYTVTITGKGNYAGTIVVPFNINDVFYLVGSMNNWNSTTPDEKYRLTKNTEAEGEYYINGVELSADDEFKVASPGRKTEWDGATWYPDGMDNNYVITADGTYDIYFRPNYDGGDDWHWGCIYVADVTPIEVTLTDGQGVTALEDYKEQEIWVNYTRSFTADKPSTVCLPFAYTPQGEEKFYSFTGIKEDDGNYTAYMTEVVSPLVANTPYLFMPTGDADFSGKYAIPASIEAGTTTSGDWTFKGTYSTIEWTSAPAEPTYGFSAQDANAGITQGQFVKVGSYVRIKPMRAYLEYNGSDSQFANARSLTRAAATTSDDTLPETIGVRLISANGEVTAIGTLYTRTGEVSFDSEAWYTLDGKRLNAKPNTKGIYVNNGKKVVIK